MRVIQLVDKLNSGGGVPSFVYDLCFALREAGCDITLIGILENNTNNKAPYEELKKAGIEVIELNAPNKKKAIIRYIPKLRVALKSVSKDAPTILNMHLKLSVLMGCLASRGLKNISCVETYHNTYLNYHLQFNILRPFIKKYITVSETSRLELINDFHAQEAKVIAAPNGVDREKIRRLAGNPEKHDYVSIVSVGRLSYEKNFVISVKALSSICSSGVHYTLIGDGPDRDKVEAARKGNKNIVLTGSLPRVDVLKYLASADLVIMPSLWEGRSILQLEAMAVGVPLVISDVPGLREPFKEEPLIAGEIFRKCKFGYLVQTDNVNSYQLAVNDFIICHDTWEAMKEEIVVRSKQNDIAEMVKKYCAVFQEILMERNP